MQSCPPPPSPLKTYLLTKIAGWHRIARPLRALWPRAFGHLFCNTQKREEHVGKQPLFFCSNRNARDFDAGTAVLAQGAPLQPARAARKLHGRLLEARLGDFAVGTAQTIGVSASVICRQRKGDFHTGASLPRDRLDRRKVGPIKCLRNTGWRGSPVEKNDWIAPCDAAATSSDRRSAGRSPRIAR